MIGDQLFRPDYFSGFWTRLFSSVTPKCPYFSDRIEKNWELVGLVPSCTFPNEGITLNKIFF